jgi:hypothetical protein
MLASTDVPVSSDPPIPAGSPIHAPSEPREELRGPAIYLVDSGSKSVYEYDTSRGRFLGPAPRVDLVQRVVTLPGYPTVVSKQPPQGGILFGRNLIVAGGLDGTVVDIPLNSKGELESPHAFTLQPAPVSFNRTRRSNGETPTGKPFIKLVAATADRLLAITHDQVTLTSEAYLLDSSSGRVLGVRQLPGGVAAAVATDGSGFVVAMSNGSLVELSLHLAVIHTTGLSTTAASVAVSGQSAYVGLSYPAKLVRVDLHSHRFEQVATAATGFSGPIAASGKDVWWALPDISAIREISTQSHEEVAEIYPCRFISSMIVYQNAVLATCIEHNQLARVDLANGSVTLTSAGGFPIALIEGAPTTR